MKLQKFKEEKKNQKVIILFTIACVLLITGVFLYKTFAIFQTNLNEDIINGEVQDIGDLEFAFYIDDGKGDQISKTAPEKDDGYSLDTSSSYCKDMTTGEKVSRINWDNERWGPYLSNITTTKTKCYLHFKKIYEEDTLNGAIPDLMNGRLVPVVISEDEKPSDITEYTNNTQSYGGKVTKADITNTSNPWYKYEDKRWANAVILRDGVVDNYLPGEEIKEKDIESYFVWIPRYKYRLKEDEATFNMYDSLKDTFNNLNDIEEYYQKIGGNRGETEVFEIEFETKESGNTLNNIQGQWLTHPAFVSFNSNGFWAGKFETGYLGAQSAEEAQKLEITNKVDISKVIIKPSVYSWKSIQVANAFYTSYNYQRELDSHMMKNSEWGAVAYLTQSKYGRCNDSICEEVRINNNLNYVTGYSAKNEPTVGSGAYHDTDSVTVNQDGTNGYQYYNSNSVKSSTTGNYYGIYDMSGGSTEYVMGVMQGIDDETNSPASGTEPNLTSNFKGPYSNCKERDGDLDCGGVIVNTTGLEWPSRKYYDLYDYNRSRFEYQRGILGDATKEMGPFYSTGTNIYVGSYNAANSRFVNSNGPWFARGGNCDSGVSGGIFTFTYNNGSSSIASSFRIVLV